MKREVGEESNLTVVKPDEHSPSQAIEVNINSDNHSDSMYTQYRVCTLDKYGVMRMALCLDGLPPNEP